MTTSQDREYAVPKTPPQEQADPAAGGGISLPIALLQALINQILRHNQQALALLAPIAGRVIALRILGTGVTLHLHLEQQRVGITRPGPRSPDVIIAGTPLALWQMWQAGNRQEGKETFGAEVTVTGDVAVAQRAKAFFKRLAVDQEEQLSHLVGDVAAHQLGNLARAAARWRRNAADTLVQDAGEYLREEIHLVPSSEEIESFVTHVDVLRDDVERLAKRIERLAVLSQDAPNPVPGSDK